MGLDRGSLGRYWRIRCLCACLALFGPGADYGGEEDQIEICEICYIPKEGLSWFYEGKLSSFMRGMDCAVPFSEYHECIVHCNVNAIEFVEPSILYKSAIKPTTTVKDLE